MTLVEWDSYVAAWRLWRVYGRPKTEHMTRALWLMDEIAGGRA